MKTDLFLLFFLGAILFLFSCGKKSKIEQDPNTVETFVEDNNGLSHFSDTLDVDEYHQMILDAIAQGDKNLFAKMASYPLKRTYPIPDIENEQQMICYFDTLFDESFRKEVANLDISSWENVGWRGWMILNGEVWDRGLQIVVNYSSPIEQHHAAYLKKKDMSRVHKSLRGNWEPYNCWHLDGSKYSDFDYSYARVDISTNQEPKDEPEFRLAIYKVGSKASDTPSIILYGELDISGSSQNETYYFSSDTTYVTIEPENIEDGKSYLYMVLHKGKTKKEYKVPCKSGMQPF